MSEPRPEQKERNIVRVVLLFGANTDQEESLERIEFDPRSPEKTRDKLGRWFEHLDMRKLRAGGRLNDGSNQYRILEIVNE